MTEEKLVTVRYTKALPPYKVKYIAAYYTIPLGGTAEVPEREAKRLIETYGADHFEIVQERAVEKPEHNRMVGKAPRKRGKRK